MRVVMLLALATTLLACRPRAVLPVPVEESAFPEELGELKLDAEVLRAIQAAADDYFPPQLPWVWLFRNDFERCLWSPSSLQYRVTAGPRVIFVYLWMDPSLCGGRFVMIHTEARYAIRRADGKILRRLLADEPDDWPPSPEKPEAK